MLVSYTDNGGAQKSDRSDPTTATFYKTVVDEYDSVAWTTRLLGITIENTYIQTFI